MAIGSWLKIGGREWNNVVVKSISQEATVLYSENTGRTMAKYAPMVLDPLGTFINYKVDVAPKKGYEREFDELFNFVIQPRSTGIEIIAVDGQSICEPFNAYISNATRDIKQIDEQTGVVKWGKMTLNIVAMQAQIAPID